MLSQPQQFTVTTGDKMVLPCRVQAEGQYTCKIGVSQAVSVTHTLVVAAPGPDPVMTPSQRRDHHTSSASYTLPASSLALMVTLVVARWSLV